MPSSVDAGIAYVRNEVAPKLEDMRGYVGLSLMADRSSGRCITTSAWESEDAMRSSDGLVQAIRSRAAEIFGGGGPTVDGWEIAVMHRDHSAGEGACVRVTWIKVDPAAVESGIEMFKTTVLPALEEHEGLSSASLLVDRASGRAVSSATYDSVETMERNKQRIDELRASATKDAGAEVLDEHDFELVIAHLRVPELV